MATSHKKLCVKCDKSGGVFTCDGCQESFCGQHTVVHRQELAHQLDNIREEHGLLRGDLTNNIAQDSILARIDTWGKESTVKIKMTAEKARADLRQFCEQLKASYNQISDELRSSRDLDNYSEVDLSRWMKKLQLLRNEIEMSTCIDIERQEGNDSINLIKIYQTDNTNATNSAHDWFDELVKDRLTATISDSISSRPLASIRGAISYSSGLHKIYFEIVNKKWHYLFFGVMSSIQQLITDAFCLSSTNGWCTVGNFYRACGHDLFHVKISVFPQKF